MPRQHQDEMHAETDQKQRQPMMTEIGKHVLDTLGRPGNLYHVQVRELWNSHYRVNVLVGPDAISVKCAHSYFLTADSAGMILSSVPKIRREY